MKSTKIMTAIAGACLALLTVAPSFAFKTVEAKIPFSFVAGDTTFPAGDYTMEWVDPTTENTLLIHSKEGKSHGMVEVEYGSELVEPSEHTRLSFAKIAGERYLRKIETTGQREVAEVSLPSSFPQREAKDTEWEFVNFSSIE